MEQTDTEEEDFQPRDYQIKLMQIALKENTIIYLPTGTGKTLIAVMILKQLSAPLERPFREGGKISVMLVNTVTLVDQQTKILRTFTHYNVGAYSGDMNVDTWSESMWHAEFDNNQVLVMTAQILVNIVAASFLSLNQVNLIIFDECHRGVNDHAMRQVMMHFKGLTDPPRVVGLTATLLNKNCSPNQVMDEVKALETTFHSKVATVDHLQHVIGYSTNPSEFIKVFRPYVTSSTADRVNQFLQNTIDILSVIDPTVKPVSPPKQNLRQLEPEKGLKGLINLIRDTMIHIDSFGPYGGKLAVTAHMIQLERIKKHCQDIKVATLLDAVMCTFITVKRMFEQQMESYSKKDQIYNFSSPQVLLLFEVLKEYKSSSGEPLCGIVFVQRRFTAKVLYNVLLCLQQADANFDYLRVNYIVGFNANPFNETREALYNSKMQKKVLSDFHNKEINLLVASNVLEEGVDIPTCTLVANYDKPTNYRAYIQSKGRARHKSSFYYMMVEGTECESFKKKYETYQQVEEILNLFLVGQNENRNLPTEDQLQGLYDEHELPPYYVDGPGGAQVSLVSAISLLCRYCSTLPADKYTVYTPNWYLESSGSLHRVVIELPLVCPLREPIEGPYMNVKKSAKRAAALKTCELLHKKGELDDNLLPKRRDVPDDDTSYFFNHWPEVKEKDAGVTRKHRMHAKQVPRVIRGAIKPDETLYLHIIELIPLFACTNLSHASMHQLYSSQLCFGVVSSNPLPQLCQFSVYITNGEIVVNFRVNQKTITLSSEQIFQIRNFHHLVFNDILKLVKRFLIFDNDENAEGLLIVPVQKDSLEIDFGIINNNKELEEQKVEPNDQEKIRIVVSEENYLGKIVTPWYRSDDKQYLVLSICTDVSALSDFPSEDFDSYIAYFSEKYHTNVLNPSQPLLLVKGLSKKLNCLRPRQSGSNKRSKEKSYEEMEEHLIPELCVKQDFPAVLWVQASLLPSILHRIISLLQAEQLRTTIAIESNLGVATLAEGGSWHPLVCDKHLLNVPVEEPTKSKPQKMIIDETGENAVVVVPTNAIQQLVQDFTSKKLEAEFPWQEKDEPIDIERHLDVTLMDIQYYENFISQTVTVRERQKKNEVVQRTDFPAITFDRQFISRDIQLLRPRTNSRGPELADILKTFLTTKSNDVVNLERLETLGDSFLKLSISLFIILKYPNYDEGKATAFKGKLISNKNLFYSGVVKNLGGYIKSSNFEPTFEWKPPTFSVPRILVDKISAKRLDATNLFSFQFSKEEQVNGVLSAPSEQNIIEYDDQLEEKNGGEESSYDSMYSFFDQQFVSDKTIADSVEALLGVYFQSCGITGGLTLLEWFGIIPASENIKNLLHMPLPDPMLARDVTINNINFHIPSWKKIEETLNYTFKNRAYLLQALTHSSYTPNRITNCYQRLEFLGDAILDFLITCHIYETCENLNPGQLTDLRSALVNNITFAGFTVRCGFHKFLLFCNNKLLDYIGNFVQYQESKDHAINDEVLILLEDDDLSMAEHVDVPKVLGDLFEALAGAIFLDSGMNLQTVWEVFYRIMWKEIELFKNNVPKNVIRLLYETVGIHPEFQQPVNTEAGSTMIGLDFMLNGQKKRVYGFGENKSLAKKAAAKIALRLIHNL